MVDVARYFMEFCMDESCGKCIPCRVGTVQMHGLLTKIQRAARRPPPTWRCWRSCATWCKHTSLCGLGQTAPNPVLSTLRYFRHEYEAHPSTAGAPSRRRAADRRRRRRSAARCDDRDQRSACVTLTIDGKDVGAREDETILEVARETRHRHPDPLPPRRPLRRRRLPALPGRGRRQPTSCCRPASRGSPRAWRSRPTPSGCASTAG